MVIDAHNHPDWLGYNVTRFLANMDQYGIDQTWILSWECPGEDYDPEGYNCQSPIGPEGPIPYWRCVRYKETAPERFVLGYCPDARRPDAVDRLAAAIERDGVQVCGEWKLRLMYDDLDNLRLWRFCGEQGLPVVIHLDYPLATGRKYPRTDWWYGGTIEALERAVAACPETVILGHGPGFWANISGDRCGEEASYPSGPVRPGGPVVEMLRKYPNLYGDLSAGSGRNAIGRDPEFGKAFVLEFADRLLFGRDNFDNLTRELLESWDLPAEVLEQVLGGNAQRLLG